MTRGLRALNWSFCAYLGWSSWATLAQAAVARDLHALILSGAELLAVAVFLFERWMVPACIVLVSVFAIAAVLTSLQGQSPLRFLYFAATAVYVVRARRTEPVAPPTPATDRAVSAF